MKSLLTPLKAAATLAFLAGNLTLLSGCGGGGATYQAAGNATLGKELQDLQQSYEKGILTNKEYESARKALIKKYTK
jgi:hypothetical protein